MMQTFQYQMHNLLKGTGDGTWANYECTKESATAFGTKVVSCVHDSSTSGHDANNTSYQDMNNTIVSGLVPRKGDSVTLSFWCRASAECAIHSYLYSDSVTVTNARKHADDGTTNADGRVTTKVGTDWTYARHTWTYDEDAGRAPRSIVARLMDDRVPNGVTVSIAGVMLVAGDTPAAWAPAEGETLDGGGARMSPNVLDGITPELLGDTAKDGIWYETTAGGDCLRYPLDISAHRDNQAFNIAATACGESDGWMDIALEYADAGGHTNRAIARPDFTTEQARRKASIVVPSNMKVTALYVSRDESQPASRVASIALWQGELLSSDSLALDVGASGDIALDVRALYR